MNYPVKVYEVLPDVNGQRQKPRLIDEMHVDASNLEKVRLAVRDEIAKTGKAIRTLSFSPNPPPDGSVVVYVTTPRQHGTVTRPENRRRRRR